MAAVDNDWATPAMAGEKGNKNGHDGGSDGVGGGNHGQGNNGEHKGQGK